MSAKVTYEVPKIPRWQPEGHRELAVKSGLPFFYNARTHKTHGIRKASNYWRDSKLTHTAVGLFCSGTGFLDDTNHQRNRMVARPEGEMCQKCQALMMVKGVWPI